MTYVWVGWLKIDYETPVVSKYGGLPARTIVIFKLEN